MNVKHSSDLLYYLEAGVASRPLKFAHIRPIHTGEVCQLFLRQSSRVPKPTKIRCERFPDIAHLGREA